MGGKYAKCLFAGLLHSLIHPGAVGDGDKAFGRGWPKRKEGGIGWWKAPPSGGSVAVFHAGDSW